MDMEIITPIKIILVIIAANTQNFDTIISYKKRTQR
jgi:hypothetical protein